MQEDPRYSQLIALRARSNGSNSVFNQLQMTQLRLVHLAELLGIVLKT